MYLCFMYIFNILEYIFFIIFYSTYLNLSVQLNKSIIYNIMYLKWTANLIVVVKVVSDPFWNLFLLCRFD